MNKGQFLRKLCDSAAKRGVTLEPYLLKGGSIAVLKFDVSADISAYLNVAYLPRKKVFTLGVGFGSPAIQSISVNCIKWVGKDLGVDPVFSLEHTCPAVIFPSFLFGEKGDFAMEESCVESVLNVVPNILQKREFSHLSTYSGLASLLSNESSLFDWYATEVPRRVVQSAYLLSQMKRSRSEVVAILEAAVLAMQGDPDFEKCSNEFISSVLDYFYRGLSTLQ